MKCSLCKNKKNDGNFIEILKCKKCFSEKAKKYYSGHKEEFIRRAALWKKNNKQKVIEESRRYRKGLKIAALRVYGNGKIQCACCGEKEVDFLCLDHIDNNGSIERRERKYGLGTSFLKWLKIHNYPKDVRLQVLCFNCNMSKRIQGGICIHKFIKKEAAKK